jgi:hypothetical protein
MRACSGLTIRYLISSALALLGCATRPAPIQTSGCAGETSLTTPDQLDLFGAPTYFNDGKPVPAGRYLMTYVDGCMKYSGDQVARESMCNYTDVQATAQCEFAVLSA